MNITALNNTGYWKPFTDGSRGASVQARVETFLKLVNPYGINSEEEVKFENNVLNISVSLGADFSMSDAKIQREAAKIENIITEYSDLTKAYECEEDDLYSDIRLPVGTAQQIYRQGHEIIICIADESNVIVQVAGLNNLKVSQYGTLPYSYKTDTAYNSEIATPVGQEGTISSGEQHGVCYLKFVLLACFSSENN